MSNQSQYYQTLDELFTDYPIESFGHVEVYRFIADMLEPSLYTYTMRELARLKELIALRRARLRSRGIEPEG